MTLHSCNGLEVSLLLGDSIVWKPARSGCVTRARVVLVSLLLGDSIVWKQGKQQYITNFDRLMSPSCWGTQLYGNKMADDRQFWKLVSLPLVGGLDRMET